MFIIRNLANENLVIEASSLRKPSIFQLKPFEKIAIFKRYHKFPFLFAFMRSKFPLRISSEEIQFISIHTFSFRDILYRNNREEVFDRKTYFKR